MKRPKEKIKVLKKQASRRKNLRTYMSSIIHDVKNPLQVILNATEYLEMKLSQADSDTKATLKEIKKRVLRLDEIMQSLAGLTKQDKKI